MQLMCDAVSVLGSRHGLLLDPVAHACRILRFDNFTRMPSFPLRAGAVINGKEYVFPFCPDGERFAFFDQRLTPCTSRFIAIEAASGLKVTLTFATPFRPRDAAYSTTPVIGVRMTVERLGGNYRWTRLSVKPETVELFFEVAGGDLAVEPRGDDAVDVAFTSCSSFPRQRDFGKPGTEWAQRDRIVAVTGARDGLRFTRRLTGADLSGSLDLAWCTHSEPVLQVHAERCPFKYAARFADLDAVCAWARAHTPGLFANAARVDGLIGANNQPKSINQLMAYTLHAWLADTWWVERGDGRDWFSVWEGNCYFHSTVDVEFTQAPFYLAVWPELLGIELDFWPEFSKDGAVLLGERGRGTRFLSHDCGQMARADGQTYPHEMEVEETTNYVILLYAHWRRTGDGNLARSKRAVVEQYLAFLVACDTTGNGVPDRGVANTIDDASPAVQYGREQVYLAVKTLAAFRCGAELLRFYGDGAGAADYTRRADAILAVIEEKGWNRDHYVTLLDKSAEGVVNPWSGQPLNVDEVPGWDACHIFTENAQAVLDLVGLDLGLDPERVKTDLCTAAERCLQEYGCSPRISTAPAPTAPSSRAWWGWAAIPAGSP